ncbi:MAG: glycoside hydrolase family 97 protein [Muribaculaceae bacterium]|nr:glycoside hydrolase family 97 protein [Muribaculaceae bacterium]
MKRTFFALMSLALVSLGVCAASVPTLSSPNGRLQVQCAVNNNGALEFTVTSNGRVVVAPTCPAMTLQGGRVLGQRVKVKKTAITPQRFDAATPIYKKDRVSLSYNLLTVNCGDYDVQFRAYDQGVAYRFVTRLRDSVTVVSEDTRFALPADCQTWMAPANSRFDSPDFRVQAFCSFENTYIHAPLSQQSRTHLSLCPVLVDLPGGGRMLLGEYNVRDYPGMFMLPDDGHVVKAFFQPVVARQHQGGHNNLQMIADEWHNYIARTAGRRAFPWRMMLVADNDADLLTCDIPRSLADAPKVDGSWVRPGKVAWDWWNDWNLTGVDFETGVNDATYKYYIDFASRNGIEYVILDEGWAVNKQADLMQVVPEIHLEELVAYARERGVDLVLWAGYKAFLRDMEGVCRHYSQMGIKGFKIDFMDRNDQEVMRFLEDAARMCAKYHLFCDFHGAPAPQGLTATFPNVLNFEAVAGLEQVKWSDAKEFDEVPHETVLPFIRQVVGPMDYTQGAMRNATKDNFYPCYNQPMSHGTRARQLALYMILESPFNMLCDTPTQYEANQPCTDFIASLPVVWDETRVLAAKVGEYVVMARRKGNDWYIGGITNWQARDVEVDLSMMAGRKVEIITDGVNADRHAEDYVRRTITASASALKVHLASGGGVALRVLPE